MDLRVMDGWSQQSEGSLGGQQSATLIGDESASVVMVLYGGY